MQTTALAASTHTTTTQLQLVSQVKDAVIRSSTVALFVLAQRGKKRPELRNSALVTLAQRGKRRPKQTLQRVVLPPSYHYTTTTCFVRGRSGMFAACLSSGMFLLSACFGMFDFGMFPSTHTHTCGHGLVLLVVATTGGAQTDSVSCMQAFIMSFLWFLVQLEVADNSSSS